MSASKTLLPKLAVAVAGFALTLTMNAASVYDFSMNTIQGTPKPLSEYKGKVLLVVNTASKCGFTPQYEALESLYKKYNSQGFLVLGFPANNFMSQEPGTNAEIQQFCTRKYNVDFPMFSKIDVKGDNQTALYKYLTAEKGGEIKWNFTKFLIGRDGTILARFEPAVKPDSPEVTAAIEKAIKE
jgi:glutathione peroxidase